MWGGAPGRPQAVARRGLTEEDLPGHMLRPWSPPADWFSCRAAELVQQHGRAGAAEEIERRLELLEGEGWSAPAHRRAIKRWREIVDALETPETLPGFDPERPWVLTDSPHPLIRAIGGALNTERAAQRVAGAPARDEAAQGPGPRQRPSRARGGA